MHSFSRMLFYSPFFITSIATTCPAYGHAQSVPPTPANTAVAQSYRSGLKSIVIPAPTQDLGEMGSDYRVLAESFVPDTNRLLAAFLTPEDSANVRAGISKAFSRYALAETLRRAEFSEVDENSFNQVCATTAQQFGAVLNSSLKDQQEEMNNKIKAMRGSDTTVSLDKPVMLGTYFSKPNACSFGMISNLSSAGNAVKMIGGITILRVQNRLIYAFVYSEYKDEESAQWVQKTSEQWADAILEANKQ